MRHTGHKTDLTRQPVCRPPRRTAVLRVALVGTVLVAGATLVLRLRDNRNALHEMLVKGQATLAEGNYSAAVDAFSKVLDDDPGKVEALEGQLEAAAGLEQAGDLDAAVAAYQTVWQARPGEVRALRGLGQVYAAKEEWDEAAGWYEKWVQVAPEDENAFLALGRARFSLSEYEHVVAAYEQAGLLGPDTTEMAVHLGLAYYELARYDEAIKRLQSAANRDLSNDLATQVYYALGGSHFERHDYERAVSFYDRARELDPEGKTAWASEARVNLERAYAKSSEGERITNRVSTVQGDGSFDFVMAPPEPPPVDGGYWFDSKTKNWIHIQNSDWSGIRALIPDGVLTNGDPVTISVYVYKVNPKEQVAVFNCQLDSDQEFNFAVGRKMLQGPPGWYRLEWNYIPDRNHTNARFRIENLKRAGWDGEDNQCWMSGVRVEHVDR